MKLTTRSSFLDFAEALRNRTEFKTSGALRGTRFCSGVGYLPSEFRESAYRADFVIYSYATPIAWLTDGDWVMPDTRYSVTTSRHQSRIGAAISVI